METLTKVLLEEVMTDSMKNRWKKALQSGVYTYNFTKFLKCKEGFSAVGVLFDINQHLGYHWVKTKTGYRINYNNQEIYKCIWREPNCSENYMSNLFDDIGMSPNYTEVINYLEKK